MPRQCGATVDRDGPGDISGVSIITNTVLLVGNLGADPTSRSGSNDTQIATLSLGTSRPKRDADGKTFRDESGYAAKETEWHRVICFGGLARSIQQIAVKGMLVSVQGRIHYTRWTDKDGQERYGSEIIAEDVQSSPAARVPLPTRRTPDPHRPGGNPAGASPFRTSEAMMDLTYYDLTVARIETIDAALAWLEACEHGDSENARYLEYERSELEAIIDGIELRLAYDAEAIMN